MATDMHNMESTLYRRWIEFHANRFGIDLQNLSLGEVEVLDQTIACCIAKERVENPQEFIEIQKNSYFNRTGIFCLSKNKFSYELWNSKRQSADGDVICLGIDKNKLEQVIKEVSNCYIDEIVYSDESKKYELIYDRRGYKSLRQLLNISFTLNTKFRHEEEVRVQRLFIENAENSPERIIKVPDEVFKEVIIFQGASQETRQEVVELARRKGVAGIKAANISDDNSVFFEEFNGL